MRQKAAHFKRPALTPCQYLNVKPPAPVADGKVSAPETKRFQRGLNLGNAHGTIPM
jgi:hypothetical protein